MAIDIKAIKAQHPLEAVIEERTGQRIEKHKIYAPWRQESTPSVHVYDDGTWWDYGSGSGGDVIDFLGFLYHGLGYQQDVHFFDVIDRLGALDIKPQPAPVAPTAKKERPKLAVSLEQIIHFHETMPQARRDYWRGRGLTDKIIDAFLLGFDGIRYTIPLMYRGVPFGIKRRESEIKDNIDAKYCMTKGSIAGIFNTDALYNAPDCIICEGEIDAMLLNQLGYRAVSSTAGAGTWKDKWSVHFASVRKITIIYDNDEAGQDGAAKVKQTLRRASILTLPEGIKDIGDLWQTGNAAKWLKGNI